MIFTEINLHPAVRESEFKRLLQVPGSYEFAGVMAEDAQWVREWFAAHGQSWLCARAVETCAVEADTVTLEGIELHSRELAKRFRHATAAVIVGASAGPEAEGEAAARWADDDPNRYYFMEAYASAVVEALIAELRGRLCPWADGHHQVVLPHYSPGYHGWTVGDQHKVFTLLRRGGELPGPLDVMESGMLQPKKSQLAIFALAPVGQVVDEGADLVPCKHCPHLRCNFRREAHALGP